MSVFRKLACALGFAPSDDTEDEQDEVMAVDNSALSSADTAGVTSCDVCHEGDNVAPQPSAESDTSLPGCIFDEVIRLFNEWQPEFVSRCLNTEAQRRYLYEAMDAQVRKALEKAMATAEANATAGYEAERSRTFDELDELKKQKGRLEETLQEMKTAHLSNMRQKRALSERVHDLEGQVVQLETDNERIQVENRGMQNRLRIASLDTQSSQMQQSSPVEPVAILADHEAETTRLNEEIGRLNDENSRLTSLNEDNQQKITLLQSEVDRMQSQIESLSAEVDRLKTEGEKSRKELDKAQNRIKELEEMRNKRDLMVAQANAETNKVRQQSRRRETDLSEELSGARQENKRLLDTVDSNMRNSIEREEALKKEIGNLMQRLKEADERFEAAKVSLTEAENRANEAIQQKKHRGRPRGKSTKHRTSENVTPQSVTPSPVIDETSSDRPVETYDETPKPKLTASDALPRYDNLSEMLPQGESQPIPPEASVASKRKVKPVISAIDELLDGSDWMTPSPMTEPVAKKRTKEVPPEDDFGYKAPPRRPHIDNDAQMSLW